MGLVLCLCGFAAAYGFVTYCASWVAISVLGWHDPKFGGAADNLLFVNQILPMVVAFATLSAFFGARVFQEWLQHHRGSALTAGCGAGALAAVGFFVSGAALDIASLGLPDVVATALFAVIRIIVPALPAATAYVSVSFMQRRMADHAI